MVPLIALTLEHRGVGPVLIGVNSAMTSLGVIAAAPLVPTVIRRLGAAEGIVAGLVLSAVSALALAYTENLALRSEEHTSELQSLMRISYSVFCLKKKKQKSEIHTPIST